MSYVKKPDVSKPSLFVPQTLNNEEICKEHGFPILEINGHRQCVYKFLHDCVVHKQVVNVIQHKKTIYFVFEDGHQLPLLCACCGESLAVESLREERENIRGRRLDELLVDTNRLQDGTNVDELILSFSPVEDEAIPLGVPVAFEVATKLRHPADCDQKGLPLIKKQLPPSKSRSRKKRRSKRR